MFFYVKENSKKKTISTHSRPSVDDLTEDLEDSEWINQLDYDTDSPPEETTALEKTNWSNYHQPISHGSSVNVMEEHNDSIERLNQKEKQKVTHKKE